MKRITMVAGPNGAGKTTTVFALLSQQKELYEDFLNADEIARGLSPLHPESMAAVAGELLIKRFRHFVSSQKSFAFESTASGRTYASSLSNAKQSGYEINLLFLWLSSPEQAIKRVELRVSQGGHNIPKDTIIRRYYRGLSNVIKLYLPLADTALILDNSAPESGAQKIIARKSSGTNLLIEDVAIWSIIQRDADVKS
jgi:predicted ABC-type ATPase